MAGSYRHDQPNKIIKIDKKYLDHLSAAEHFARQDLSSRRGGGHGLRLSELGILTDHHNSQEEEIKQIEEEEIEDSGAGDLIELGASALNGFLGLLGAKIDLLRSLLTNKVNLREFSLFVVIPLGFTRSDWEDSGGWSECHNKFSISQDRGRQIYSRISNSKILDRNSVR